MVFKDPPSSVTTYRRLHIQSIIKVTLHSPDTELSPCVLAYLLVCSGHCACDVKRGQVYVGSACIMINKCTAFRTSEAIQKHNSVDHARRLYMASARCCKYPKGSFLSLSRLSKWYSCMARRWRGLMLSELDCSGIG